MRELIVRDDRELRRVERAIANIRRDPGAAKGRCQSLLAALEAERAELLKLYGRQLRSQRMAAAA